MYKRLLVLAVAVFSITSVAFAQDKMQGSDESVKNIRLEQTKGVFAEQELTLESGTYQFEIFNNNVGVDVGFVLAPADNPDQHIKEAYVTELVKNNTSQKSEIVTLSPGEYIYFCPLNKTPQYKLTVE